ncbi:PadR family transcriptional regulator [Sphingomonas sp. CGMCC 1.13654]|uniref:PadR family transcriptional regulator n=1 Tax=Sphingomonas chungangi TaxID=2683589 RepID=A0A838L9C2_9SPHN|nr:PadR family transcriptional regulator [Sphingomonas chungangi]MBA2935315.1 PadR family transcriptional regulator [Sphingomonas chungangi]
MALLRAGSKSAPSAVFERMLLGQPKASFGAVYTTLTRLAAKGLADETSSKDESGRARRVFTISGSGRRALQQSLDATATIGGFSVEGGFGALA